jgi:hypothetical protein
MEINKDLIKQFEKQLNPQNLNESSIPAKIVGFGEISAIFQLNGNEDVVYKRMPLFKTKNEAENYAAMYREYCDLLKDAGLNLPNDELFIVEHEKKRPVVLYIAQENCPENMFCHNLIHSLKNEDAELLIEQVAKEIQKVWDYNKVTTPSLELALDGQLSNWVCKSKGNGSEYDLYYIDTSTPLYRKKNVEQQNPELLLQSAPGFLRWMIRLFFLSDVMNRYYNLKEVYKDLAGNLYKEQRSDLIPAAIEIVNQHLGAIGDLLTLKDVEKYYKEDKIIWSVFLSFRRIDCFIKTKILFSRYEFMLPGKIER